MQETNLIYVNMKRTLGLILIIGAMVLGYLGIRDLGSSSTSVDILGIELSAEDNKAKEMAYVKIGLGVVALIAGVYLFRSEEHTSELQSRPHLVCRLLLEKK